MISRRQKKATPGYFNFLDGAEVTAVYFMFNPAEVSIRHSWGHGVEPIPGRSHPRYSGGAGGEELFNFTLELDADRGYLERRRRTSVAFGNVEAFLSASFETGLLYSASGEVEDLRPAIDKITQYTLPGEEAGSIPGSYGVPRRLTLNLGSVLTAEVGIKNYDVVITKYGPDLNILRANIAVSGHVIENSNVTDRSKVRRYQSLDRDRPDIDKDERYASAPSYKVD